MHNDSTNASSFKLNHVRTTTSTQLFTKNQKNGSAGSSDDENSNHVVTDDNKSHLNNQSRESTPTLPQSYSNLHEKIDDRKT